MNGGGDPDKAPSEDGDGRRIDGKRSGSKSSHAEQKEGKRARAVFSLAYCAQLGQLRSLGFFEEWGLFRPSYSLGPKKKDTKKKDSEEAKRREEGHKKEAPMSNFQRCGNLKFGTCYFFVSNTD